MDKSLVKPHFAAGNVDDANALVVNHHYSGRAPANVQCVGTWHEDGGLFGDQGTAVAACFFSIPATRWPQDVLELSRLVRRPDVLFPLSALISQTVGHLKRKKICNLVVSFADWTQGHHGGIYQAASWNYAGKRDRTNDGCMIDGVFVPGRSCNSRWGTRSPTKLAEIMPGHTVEPHFDEGKHLYWKATDRDGMKKAVALGLDVLPYPRPSAP